MPPEPESEVSKRLRLVRLLIVLFMVGLILSGATAMPLLKEVDTLANWMGVGNSTSPEGHTGLAHWILKVREGLRVSYSAYPFLAYGTDWLAFGHFAIALFFVGVLRDPVRNVWVIRAGMITCVLVIPWALVYGALRGIPFYWRLIDCSFGVIGFVPLWIALRLVRRLSPSAEASPGRS